MKPTLKAALLLVGLLSCGSLCAEEVLIQSDFPSIIVNENVAEPPTSAAELPLKTPTRITAKEPSTVEVGTDPVGDLKPPYALIKIEPLAENPESSGIVNIRWDLSKLPLEPGRYQLSWRFAVIQPDGSPGRVRIILLNDAGKPLEGHSASLPPVVSFGGGRFYSDKCPAPKPIRPGESYELEIVLDTKELTWGVKINGEFFREEQPFTQEYIDQLQNGATIGRVEYEASGGLGDGPGAELAIGNVVFKKL